MHRGEWKLLQLIYNRSRARVHLEERWKLSYPVHTFDFLSFFVSIIDHINEHISSPSCIEEPCVYIKMLTMFFGPWCFTFCGVFLSPKSIS